jgi:hypothetical protein
MKNERKVKKNEKNKNEKKVKKSQSKSSLAVYI